MRRGNRRPLRPHEIVALLEDSGEDDFSPDDSDNDPDYAVSENEDFQPSQRDQACASATPEVDDTVPEPEVDDLIPDVARGGVVPAIWDSSDDDDSSVDGKFNDNDNNNNDGEEYTCVWSDPTGDFLPRYILPEEKHGEVITLLPINPTERDVFLKLFPPSLFLWIAQCTNNRIASWNAAKNQSHKGTNSSEIRVLLGIVLVMSYNVLPSMADYWSNNPSMGNQYIKKKMARDRFLFLMSKLYFNIPEKPENASKTYYTTELVNCLKYTFTKCYSDSSHQAIDETMVRFKGCSTLKQYMPMKPIKRGIKIWSRCDSLTGYLYDFNIYSGKEGAAHEGTLGERVVLNLVSTINKSEVALCFDRFFTSIQLLDTMAFPAVGTVMSNRRNVPKFSTSKGERGHAEFKINNNGTVAVKWQDTKEVRLASNCHQPLSSHILRKKKDGEKISIPCPDLCQFYNKYMGGVDLADQKISSYDFERKSLKWWKKVFYKLLFASVSNAWIIHSTQSGSKKKLPQIVFIMKLAEQLVDGFTTKPQIAAKRNRVSTSLGTKRTRLDFVGKHLPEKRGARKRCKGCLKAKKPDSKTVQYCTDCDVPLCRLCFLDWHTQ